MLTGSDAGALRMAEIARQLQSGAASGTSPPLHQYKLDAATLRELEELLSARLSDREPSLNRAESAAFVLFCAHHFTRKYSGGQWTWATAKGTVDPENRLGPPVLYEVVDRGLRAWGRSVYWNGRNHEYLYTVGREGGLPLGVLVSDRGEGLRHFMQRLLARIETSSVPAEEAAAELQHHLPPQLQQTEILRLAAELVRRVAELRDAVPQNTSPTIRWLDEHVSGWRDQLPLRTNDEVAAALISGLVQQERPRAREQAFALLTQLVNGRLQRTLQMPRRTTRQELLGSEGDAPLPSRLRIAVSNGRVQSVRAMATHIGNDEYAIERLTAEPLQGSSWFGEEVRLVLSVGERELVTRALPGGEVEGDAALPWVFETDAAGGWVLVSRGSYSSKSESLIIAHRVGGGTLSAGSGVLEVMGEDPVLGWSFTRIRGAARWEGEQDVCEIVSRTAMNSGHFELKGTSEHLAGTGSFVWRGRPDVYVRSAQGVSTRVQENKLEWRPTGAEQPWQRVGLTCLGDVQLRAREGQRTLYRARLAVVPSDLRLELSASQVTAGTLRVLGSRVTGARVLSRGVEGTVRTEPGGVTIAVQSAEPPADLELELCLGPSARLRLRVPFPSEFCGFVSFDGKPLPNHGRIGVDMLHRWTARAVSCDPAQRYVLEARTEQGIRPIVELPQSSPGFSELPLSHIRPALEACLSGTRSIDAFVPLRVTRHTGLVTGARARTEVRLGWHEAQLDVAFDGESAAVQLPQQLLTGLDEWQLRDFRVIARPLHSPASEPIVLDGSARAGWAFSPAQQRLWLLTGWVGNALITRPRLVQFDNVPSLPPEAPAMGAPSLASAMRKGTLEERRASLAGVYRVLASDYAHEDWLRVDEFLRTLHELPSPTYDVICGLASAKPAAVVALFRQQPEHFDVVWHGLEQLGVSWHTLPFGLWLRAARLGRDFAFASPHAEQLGGKAQLLRHAMSGLLEHVRGGPHFFRVLLGALNTYLEGFPAEEEGSTVLRMARTQPGRAMLRQQIREACVELRRRVDLTNDRFPPVRVSSHECCPDIRRLLEDFGLSDQVAYTWECLAAPLVAAHAMVYGSTLTSEFLDDLRLLRSFDDEWFEFAHAASLTVLLGKKLEQDDEFFERSESQLLGTDV